VVVEVDQILLVEVVLVDIEILFLEKVQVEVLLMKVQ